jgi:hypothetical protein
MKARFPRLYGRQSFILDRNDGRDANRRIDEPKYSDVIVMNTAKILGALPQMPAAAAPAPTPPARPQPGAVPAVSEREGASERFLREQAQLQAEAAERRAERARRESARIEPYTPYMQREVGLVDRSFDVFVDLVTPTESYRVRIFGPQEFYGRASPAAATVGPAVAQAAYEAAGGEPQRAAVKTDV